MAFALSRTYAAPVRSVIALRPEIVLTSGNKGYLTRCRDMQDPSGTLSAPVRR